MALEISSQEERSNPLEEIRNAFRPEVREKGVCRPLLGDIWGKEGDCFVSFSRNNVYFWCKRKENKWKKYGSSGVMFNMRSSLNYVDFITKIKFDYHDNLDDSAFLHIEDC